MHHPWGVDASGKANQETWRFKVPSGHPAGRVPPQEESRGAKLKGLEALSLLSLFNAQQTHEKFERITFTQE